MHRWQEITIGDEILPISASLSPISYKPKFTHWVSGMLIFGSINHRATSYEHFSCSVSYLHKSYVEYVSISYHNDAYVSIRVSKF